MLKECKSLYSYFVNLLRYYLKDCEVIVYAFTLGKPHLLNMKLNLHNYYETSL